jgi:DNA-binding NarL/FixJ family response regulator
MWRLSEENRQAEMCSERTTRQVSETPGYPQVLLVDDHPLVGASLGAAIERQGGVQETVTTLEAARTALIEKPVDVLLLDINFPEGPGTDLLKDDVVVPHVPRRCFLISGAIDPDEVMCAFDDGALGFISKSIPFDDLESALGQIIRDEAEGGDALMWDSARRSFRPVREVFTERPLLSPREREVFRLLRQGLQDKEIAHQMGRSIHTVRVQIRSIRRKRGQSRRAEANEGATRA